MDSPVQVPEPPLEDWAVGRPEVPECSRAPGETWDLGDGLVPKTEATSTKTDPVEPNQLNFEDAPRPSLFALGEAQKAELVVTEGFDLDTLSKTLSSGLMHADFLLEGFIAPAVAPELEDKGPHSTAGVWSMYIHNVSRPGCRHVCDNLMKEYRWPVEEFPSYMRRIKVHQMQVPAFRTPLMSTPLPMIENIVTCSEFKQIVH